MPGASRGAEFWGNLARRVGTAAVALPALLALMFLAPPRATVALVAVATFLGLWEFNALLAARGVRPFRLVGGLVAAGVFAEIVVVDAPALWAVPVLPLAVLLVLGTMLQRADDIPGAVPAAAATLLGACYLGGLGGALAALRALPPADVGAWRLTLLLAIIMSADTLAFFAGSAFGRHKLAPRISPGKTLEGLAGGLVGGILAALVVRRLGLPHLPLVDAIALGAVVSGLGVVGDLAESLLKRWAGVKDSGALFPGHGGMLDRLDSLLFGAPVLYYYFLILR
jgi:phosphatidate cytidylyltransferase